MWGRGEPGWPVCSSTGGVGPGCWPGEAFTPGAAGPAGPGPYTSCRAAHPSRKPPSHGTSARTVSSRCRARNTLPGCDRPHPTSRHRRASAVTGRGRLAGGGTVTGPGHGTPSGRLGQAVPCPRSPLPVRGRTCTTGAASSSRGGGWFPRSQRLAHSRRRTRCRQRGSRPRHCLALEDTPATYGGRSSASSWSGRPSGSFRWPNRPARTGGSRANLPSRVLPVRLRVRRQQKSGCARCRSVRPPGSPRRRRTSPREPC